MKKLIILFLLLPSLAFTQNKIVLNTFRVFPIPGKAIEFKRALIAHVSRFHTTEKKWRIFEIMSGPDAGAFHFVEGPSTWDEIEKAPVNTDQHTTDWDKTVEVFIEKTTNVGFSVYQENLSSAKLTEYANNIVLTHMYPKPGMVGKANEMLAKMKKVNEMGGESVAVFNVLLSGDPQMVSSRRLKNGLKDMEPIPGKSTEDRWREAFGANSWSDYMADYANIYERRWTELLTFRADLSSK